MADLFFEQDSSLDMSTRQHPHFEIFTLDEQDFSVFDHNYMGT